MNISLFQRSYIQFLFPEICIIFLSELFELPKEGSSICDYYSMSNLFENLIGFYSWVLEKVPIYGCYLMRLAELYWSMRIVFVYGSVYSVSSINHCKERRRISRMRQIIQENLVIFLGFLKDVFGCKDISSNSIYCDKKSPLTF